MLIDAAVAEGITSIATVHDSLGCLPAHAERFRRIIREQFVQLYKDHETTGPKPQDLHSATACARSILRLALGNASKLLLVCTSQR